MGVLDQTQINTIASEVDEAVRYSQLSKASQLSGQIKETLKQGGLSDDLIQALNRYLYELQFVRFLAISEAELFTLFAHHLTLAYEIPDYDLVQKFGDRFALAGFPDQQAEFLGKILQALEQNDEFMGQTPLKSKNGELKPTLGNWIKLYNETPFTNRQRGPLEAIQFIEKNGAGLSDVEKLMLTEIFKIYNGSKNWLTEYNALPEATESDEIPDSVLLDILYGPQERTVSTAQSNKPRSMDGVKSAQSPVSATSVINSPEAKKLNSTGLADLEVNPQNASRIQELLYKKSVTEPSKVAPSVSPEAIEAKLAELKSRIDQE